MSRFSDAIPVRAIVLGVLLFLGLSAIMLFMPPLHQHHHFSDRSQTNNYLHQAIIAVHAYHDTFKRLPDGYRTGDALAKKNGSLWYQLTPFLEQNDVYTKGIGDVVVLPFLAPSDKSYRDGGGYLSFAANVRIFGHQTLVEQKQPVDEPSKAVDLLPGAMICGLTIKDFPGGTANTIAMTTRYANCDGRKTLYAADAFGNSNLSVPPGPATGGFMGAGSASAAASGNGDVNAIFQITPRESKCNPQPGLFGHSFGVGGMSVALADGVVRNISPTMNPMTFARALCLTNAAPGPDWNDD